MQPGVPQDRGIRSWRQWRVQSTGLPEVSSCLCSRDRDSTAHIQQCSMKLNEGGNKRLDFSFSCLAGAPRGGDAGDLCCCPLSRGDTHCQHDQCKNQVRTNLPQIQPLVVGILLSLPDLETPLRTWWLNMCPGPLCSRCWSDHHRAAQGGVRKRMRRKTSEYCALKQYPFCHFHCWAAPDTFAIEFDPGLPVLNHQLQLAPDPPRAKPRH